MSDTESTPPVSDVSKELPEWVTALVAQLRAHHAGPDGGFTTQHLRALLILADALDARQPVVDAAVAWAAPKIALQGDLDHALYRAVETFTIRQGGGQSYEYN